MTLALPTSSNSYGYSADTRPPAPSWLIDKTPGAAPLMTAFDHAKEAARVADEAHRAATVAFRGASRIDRNNEWEPLPDVEYDKWRALRSKMDVLREPAEYSTQHAVRNAWYALRDHVATNPEAEAVVRAMVTTRHEEAVSAARALRESVASFAEVDTLIPDEPAARNDFDGLMSRKSKLAALARLADDYFTPEPGPWRYTKATA